MGTECGALSWWESEQYPAEASVPAASCHCYSTPAGRRRTSSLLRSLDRRQLNGSSMAQYRSSTDSFYRTIVPNFSLINILEPDCYVRKFTPDGRYLIATDHGDNLVLFTFQGSERLNTLLESVPSELDCLGLFPPNASPSFLPLERAFDAFFTQRRHVSFPSRMAHARLSQELLLFSADSRYCLVAFTRQMNPSAMGYDAELVRGVSSLTPSPSLYDVSYHFIDIETAQHVDEIQFSAERLSAASNLCVSWRRDMLAILSVQHQTVYQYRVVNGTTTQLREISRFCCPAERQLYMETCHMPQSDLTEVNIMSALKQKMLVWLYKRSRDSSYFHHQAHVYNDLKLLKMQIVDDDRLLLKLVSYQHLAGPEPPNNYCHNGNCLPACFLLYNFTECKVELLADNTDTSFLRLFERCSEQFQANDFDGAHSRFTCCTSNNRFTKQVFHRTHNTIKTNRYGSAQEACRRSLGLLPHPCQLFVSSPYFDPNLFEFDDKWVNLPYGVPLSATLYPIKFLDRTTGRFSFKVFTGIPGRTGPPYERPAVAFICHPTEPFLISIQKAGAQSAMTMNFHVRFRRMS